MALFRGFNYFDLLNAATEKSRNVAKETDVVARQLENVSQKILAETENKKFIRE